ncbi:MAG TPA: LLM class flavin-dependent oxidoreductase [Solirubrobacteraceae bacterium]|nr:LLM class flavin-dependent oxidoreductase [Solirubrobacteraceae bacterium]
MAAADGAVASSSKVRWGVLLPTFDALHTGETPPLVAGARLAEELGFDAGWVGDHLVCNAPVLDSTMALAAAAAATSRFSLGFSVMLLGLRDPERAADQIDALGALCGGRLSLGVGIGGEHPEEFEAAGIPVSRRGRRLDEILGVLPDLLTGRAVEFSGETIEVHASPTQRFASARPAIIVGGRGEPALRRAARYGDAWLPMWLSPDAIAERARELRELAIERGRPSPSLTLLLLVHVDEDLELARRRAAEHLQGQYCLPLHVVERWAALGPASQVAEIVQRYLDVGIGELILMPLGERPLEQYERFAQVRALVAGAS